MKTDTMNLQTELGKLKSSLRNIDLLEKSIWALFVGPKFSEKSIYHQDDLG